MTKSYSQEHGNIIEFNKHYSPFHDYREICKCMINEHTNFNDSDEFNGKKDKFEIKCYWHQRNLKEKQT